METLGWVLAAVLVVVAAVAWWRARQVSAAARARNAELQRQVEGQTAAAAQSDLRANEASSALQRAQAELAEAIRQRDEQAVAKALWKLELDRTERQWADVVVLDSQSLSDLNTGQQLNAAINCEVDRLREEVGVAIRYNGNLTEEIDVEVALGALRIASEVLSLGAKMADEINITASTGAQDDQSGVSIVVECSGWESPDEDDVVDIAGSSVEGDLGSLMTDLVGVANKLNGSLVWEEIDDDTRKAVLQLATAKNAVAVADPQG